MIEFTCQVCGETFVSSRNDSTHAITLAGEYCGGVGVVTGSFWPSRDNRENQENQDMLDKQQKAERRAARQQAEHDEICLAFTEFTPDMLREATVAAIGIDDPDLEHADIHIQAAIAMLLEQGNETNRLLSELGGQLNLQIKLLGYLIR